MLKADKLMLVLDIENYDCGCWLDCERRKEALSVCPIMDDGQTKSLSFNRVGTRQTAAGDGAG